MKILVVSDSYKGTLSSSEVGKTISEVFAHNGLADTSYSPMTDGGDGMADVISETLKGEDMFVHVKGPFFETVTAHYVLCGKTAIIESAEACGLNLVPPEERDVMNTTTHGVGEIILDAVKNGAETVLVGLGGTATNDGGCGMAYALGAKFLQNGKTFIPFGRTLERIEEIDLTKLNKKLNGVKIIGCTDVDCVFHGKNGAAYMFAAQKGATREEIIRLDEGMKHLASLVKTHDLKKLPGSGAAGGLGGGIAAFLGGELKSGFDMFASLLDTESKIADADIVITGEGCTDAQTLSGKLPLGILNLCKKLGKKCILISGSVKLSDEEIKSAGFDKAFACIKKPLLRLPSYEEAEFTLSEAAKQAAEYIKAI